LTIAEFVRAVHVVEVPAGVEFSNLLRPDYWTHCAKKFKPYALIEARAQDNRWIADLMVAAVGERGVSMWVKSFIDLDAQAKQARAEEDRSEGEFTVSFAPRQKWRVIRKSDGEVLYKDAPNEVDAQAWLDSHLKEKAL
jgi:hypothetical protein